MQFPPRTPRRSAPARLEPLARLPLFVDLKGRRALVAGAAASLAWKAELLAAAGAEVRLAVDPVDGEIASLIARGSAAGSYHPLWRVWREEDLDGVFLAVFDSDDADEIAAFRAAARAAGASVNVVDRPADCDVQFGSIVNRSPVVIGISTDGAAPVLGQAIRRRIETLLPPFIADWGRLARRIRDRVTEALAPGAGRRSFWDAFAERAFVAAPTETDEAELLAATRRATAGRSREGKVVLVGAGPGDAELLTLKAVRALQAADVVLADDLVPDEVLELARREASRIRVGKRGGRASCRQDDINDLMLSLAREGNHVVRLKAGDPMVFGRAGEEIERLAAAGVPVEVVPGISAGVALASALGVSLTHRDHAQSLRFVTGHGRDGELDETADWRGLADPQQTLVVYMGGRTAARLAARLIAEGLPPETPAVLGYAVGRPEARFERLRLADLVRDGAIEAGPPVVIGIGRVFAAAAVPVPRVESSRQTEMAPV